MPEVIVLIGELGTGEGNKEGSKGSKEDCVKDLIPICDVSKLSKKLNECK